MPTDPRGFIGATAAAVMTAAGSTVRAASLPLPEYERLDATALADELRRGRITALPNASGGPRQPRCSACRSR